MVTSETNTIGVVRLSGSSVTDPANLWFEMSNYFRLAVRTEASSEKLGRVENARTIISFA